MSQFSGNSAVASKQFAVENNAAAKTGADKISDRRFKPLCSSAEDFAKNSAIAIIAKIDFSVKKPFKMLFDGKIFQSQVRGVKAIACFRVN
jgi:hypothetical protein